MEYFFELFSDLPRQGPGSDEATRKAFEKLPALPTRPKILDIGCGCGCQSLELARLTHGEISAVDFHQPYLDELEKKAALAGLSGYINAVCTSMESLKFPNASFDLIWSEGAVYIIGFEEGLHAWRPLLKPGACQVLSEISWTRPKPPDEIKAFWESQYPKMGTIEQNISLVEGCGYQLLAHFPLPRSCWWDTYYHPLEERFPRFQEKYADNPDALQVLEMTRREIELFRKYSDWYGTEFYIMQSQNDGSKSDMPQNST
jgi:ubiquinone/menaquinone biosynthesis C-methylase UbiE